jgi:hypothetical protein
MLEELKSRASALLNREVEVEKTKDGKYVVLYMSLSSPPPPKGSSEEEALKFFVEWYESMPRVNMPEGEE